jgi:branched-chain amino acid transport system permease protein
MEPDAMNASPKGVMGLRAFKHWGAPQKLSWVLALLVLPLLLQPFGNAWVRILDMALIYTMLALGLNIVVGFAGLLDLGYVAFFALGAYLYALLASPQLMELLSAWPVLAPFLSSGIHVPWWVVMPLAAILAALMGVILGAPTLKLRGDYLAIVTLGFGEIIRVFLNNLDQPINITNGPRGLGSIDPIQIAGHPLSKKWVLGPIEFAGVTQYYFLLVVMVALSLLVCSRLEHSRVGRAWVAIREDEIAARAMGLNTRNLKLLAFAMGATFGGVSGVFFAAFQSFISPESFGLGESVMIVAMVVLGGLGHLPGVVLGALLLATLPELLRYVATPLQELTGGRIDAAILRQLLIALTMVVVMLWRPQGLWPASHQNSQGTSS